MSFRRVRPFAEATADHRARLAETPFVNPIPDHVEPPLVQAR